MKNILEVLKEYDLDIDKEGSVLRTFCPFHDDSGKPNFTVYPSTDSWYCFACNLGGNTAKFISLIENISYAEALSQLEDPDIEVTELKEKLETETEEVQTFNAEVNIEASRHCRKFLQAHPDQAAVVFKYLKNLDHELQYEITYNKMKEILDVAKKTLVI